MEVAEDDAGGLSVFKLLKLKRDPKEFTLRESSTPPEVNQWVIKLSGWLASDVSTEKLSHIINTQLGIARITYDVTMRDKYRQCGASFNLDATDHCIPLRNEMDQLLQYISTRHVGSVTQIQHLKTEVEAFLKVITTLEKGMGNGEVKAGRVKLTENAEGELQRNVQAMMSLEKGKRFDANQLYQGMDTETRLVDKELFNKVLSQLSIKHHGAATVIASLEAQGVRSFLACILEIQSLHGRQVFVSRLEAVNKLQAITPSQHGFEGKLRKAIHDLFSITLTDVDVVIQKLYQIFKPPSHAHRALKEFLKIHSPPSRQDIMKFLDESNAIFRACETDFYSLSKASHIVRLDSVSKANGRKCFACQSPLHLKYDVKDGRYVCPLMTEEPVRKLKQGKSAKNPKQVTFEQAVSSIMALRHRHHKLSSVKVSYPSMPVNIVKISKVTSPDGTKPAVGYRLQTDSDVLAAEQYIMNAIPLPASDTDVPSSTQDLLVSTLKLAHCYTEGILQLADACECKVTDLACFPMQSAKVASPRQNKIFCIDSGAATSVIPQSFVKHDSHLQSCDKVVLAGFDGSTKHSLGSVKAAISPSGVYGVKNLTCSAQVLDDNQLSEPLLSMCQMVNDMGCTVLLSPDTLSCVTPNNVAIPIGWENGRLAMAGQMSSVRTRNGRKSKAHKSKAYSSSSMGDGPDDESDSETTSSDDGDADGLQHKWKPGSFSNHKSSVSLNSQAQLIVKSAAGEHILQRPELLSQSDPSTPTKRVMLTASDMHDLGHASLQRMKRTIMVCDGIRVDFTDTSWRKCFACGISRYQALPKTSRRHSKRNRLLPTSVVTCLGGGSSGILQSHGLLRDVETNSKLYSTFDECLDWRSHIDIPAVMSRGHINRFLSIRDLWPFGVIFADNKILASGAQPAYANGVKVLLILVDIYSTRKFVYLLRSKADNGLAFRSFIMDYQLQRSRLPSIVFTDKCGSMLGVRSECIRLGLCHMYTPPNEGNHPGEAAIRSVMESAVAMQVHGKIPVRFLPQVCRASAHIDSHLATDKQRDFKSPIELLTGFRPSLHRLYPPGTICFIRPHKSERHSQRVAIDGISRFQSCLIAKLLGYPDARTRSICEVLVLATGAIRQTRQIVFVRGVYDLENVLLYGNANVVDRAICNLFPECANQEFTESIDIQSLPSNLQDYLSQVGGCQAELDSESSQLAGGTEVDHLVGQAGSDSNHEVLDLTELVGQAGLAGQAGLDSESSQLAGGIELEGHLGTQDQHNQESDSDSNHESHELQDIEINVGENQEGSHTGKRYRVMKSMDHPIHGRTAELGWDTSSDEDTELSSDQDATASINDQQFQHSLETSADVGTDGSVTLSATRTIGRSSDLGWSKHEMDNRVRGKGGSDNQGIRDCHSVISSLIELKVQESSLTTKLPERGNDLDYKQFLKSEFKNIVVESINDEITKLEGSCLQRIDKTHPQYDQCLKKAVPGRFLLSRKRDTSFKSRLVKQGCREAKHMNFGRESYTHVVDSPTVRMILAQPTTKYDNLATALLDIQAAYTQGWSYRKDEPTRFLKARHPVSGEWLYFIEKVPIYGGAIAGRNFEDTLYCYLAEIGLTQGSNCKAIFATRHIVQNCPNVEGKPELNDEFQGNQCSEQALEGDTKKGLVVAAYVDDLMLTGHGVSVRRCIRHLYHRFKIKRVDFLKDGMSLDFLGVSIRQLKLTRYLEMAHYIKQSAEELKIDEGYGYGAPMDRNIGTSPPLDAKEATWFRTALGKLAWIANCVRPDVRHAFLKLGHFNATPSQNAMDAMIRTWKYLLHNRWLSLRIDMRMTATCPKAGWKFYSDSDYAGDPFEELERPSTQGCIALHNNVPILWRSGYGIKATAHVKLRPGHADLSVASAETYALSDGLSQFLGLSYKAEECLIECKLPITVWVDNEAAKTFSNDAAYRTKMVHIDSRQCWVKQLRDDKVVSVQHVPSRDNLADLFTKVLTPKEHKRLREMLLVGLPQELRNEEVKL